MAPTLETAKKRRYWLVGTMIFENLFFSAVLLGWSSLLPVLLSEGFYSNVCTEDAFENDNSTSNVTFINGYPRCDRQDEKLNLAFTVGSFLLSGLTFPIGLAMDKFGSRKLRILGASMFIVSCLLFGWATVETSWFLFPAVALNGVGGIMTTFTSFQVANLFPSKRSTIVSFSIGSYASAAILFLILKMFYDFGIPRQYIFTGVAIATLFVIINCIINVPEEAVPDPEEAKFGIHWHILRTDHKVTGKQFYSLVSSVGRRLSVNDDKPPAEIPLKLEGRRESKIFSSEHNLVLKLDLENLQKKAKKSSKDMSLIGNVFTPLYLLSLIVMCITQLRLLFFIGSLQSMLNEITNFESDTVDSYLYVFGILQLMCLVTSPLIGTVMDYKIKETLDILKGKQRRKSSAKRSMSITIKAGDDSVFIDETNDIVKSNGRKTSLPDFGKPSIFGNFSRSKSFDLGQGKLPSRGSTTTTKSRLSSTDSAGSDMTDGEKPPMSLKIRKLLNGAYAFGITNTLLMMFGVTVLIPSLQVQIVSFILHTIIRGFIHSACCGLYAIVYPASQTGSLIGLQSLISACFTLFQYPIFVVIQGPLGGNPFYVNVVLLVMSVLNYGMPVYMVYYAKKLRRKQKTEADEDKQKLLSSRPSKVSLPAVPEDV
ncbi:large neutral amino acids transporter small subunit 4-like [Acanthaster planci]|uniref:Large neutral amino acids transporter small subunit 4-like n=1 Tax=Acanthaster planci TaxID=133434 RepID=A0A8B7ZBG3_ACAPL|nr:large neutral amino acids transporter small subunit 4-like [Acanthaster planci]